MSFSSSSNRRKTNVSILINVPFVWTRFYKVCTECKWTDKKRTALKIPYDCAKDGNMMIVDTKRWTSLIDVLVRTIMALEPCEWHVMLIADTENWFVLYRACPVFVNSVQVARGWNRNGFCRFFDTPYMSSFSHRNLSRSTNTILLDSYCWLFYWLF